MFLSRFDPIKRKKVREISTQLSNSVGIKFNKIIKSAEAGEYR